MSPSLISIWCSVTAWWSEFRASHHQLCCPWQFPPASGPFILKHPSWVFCFVLFSWWLFISVSWIQSFPLVYIRFQRETCSSVSLEHCVELSFVPGKQTQAFCSPQSLFGAPADAAQRAPIPGSSGMWCWVVFLCGSSAHRCLSFALFLFLINFWLSFETPSVSTAPSHSRQSCLLRVWAGRPWLVTALKSSAE